MVLHCMYQLGYRGNHCSVNLWLHEPRTSLVIINIWRYLALHSHFQTGFAGEDHTHRLCQSVPVQGTRVIVVNLRDVLDYREGVNGSEHGS